MSDEGKRIRGSKSNASSVKEQLLNIGSRAVDAIGEAVAPSEAGEVVSKKKEDKKPRGPVATISSFSARRVVPMDSPPGAAREAFSRLSRGEKPDGLDDAVGYTVNGGTPFRYLQVNNVFLYQCLNGDVHSLYLAKEVDQVITLKRSIIQFQRALSNLVPALGVGVLPVNKLINNNPVPCGVILLIGVADAGKTPLAHAFASAGGSDYETARFGEPFLGYVEDLEFGLTELLIYTYIYQHVVFDSAKDMLAMLNGDAMTSGISRGVWPFITNMSNGCAYTGSTVYIPLNPSVKKAEVLEEVLTAASSNAAGYAVPEHGSNRWMVKVRTGEAKTRISYSVGLSNKGQGKPTLLDQNNMPFASSASSIDPDNALHLDLDSSTEAQEKYSVYQAALRRSLNRQ